MRNVDMIYICHKCMYYKTIYYATGAVGIGCLAYNVKSPHPVDIVNLEKCPLGKHEKK